MSFQIKLKSSLKAIPVQKLKRMQKSKSMAIMAEIFNKFSNKSFVSKTCETHPAFLPIYICQKCFPSNNKTYCQECFRQHQCEGKVKGQISRWISSQQQKMGNLVSQFLRDYDSCNKQWIAVGRVRIPGKFQQKYLSEVNNELIIQMTTKLEKIVKSVELDCIKSAMQSRIKPRMEEFISSIKIQLNGMTGDYQQMQDIVNKFTHKAKQLQIETQNQSKQIADNCEKFYKESVRQEMEQILRNTMGFNNEQVHQKSKQKLQQKLLFQKVSDLQKQIQTKNSLIQKLEFQLNQETSKSIKNLQEQRKQIKEKQKILLGKEQRVSELQKKVKEMQQKIRTYAQLSASIDGKDVKIRKLEQKCKVYEEQLAQIARSNVSDQEKLENRYNMEDLAKKLVDISERYEHLVIDCNGKDKKIAQLVFQIHKLQLDLKKQSEQNYETGSGKKNQQKPENNSGKKIQIQ